MTKATACFSTTFGGLYPILVNSPASAAGRVSFLPQAEEEASASVNKPTERCREVWPGFSKKLPHEIPAVHVPGSEDFTKQGSEKEQPLLIAFLWALAQAVF